MVLSWAVEGGACGYGSFSVKQCADRIALASLLDARSASRAYEISFLRRVSCALIHSSCSNSFLFPVSGYVPWKHLKIFKNLDWVDHEEVGSYMDP